MWTHTGTSLGKDYVLLNIPWFRGHLDLKVKSLTVSRREFGSNVRTMSQIITTRVDFYGVSFENALKKRKS